MIQIRRDSEEIWLSVSEAIMRDPAGAVAGRIYGFRDVSSDRLVEQLKSGFVSAVSHELRAPLTSIYGFAETLLREDVSFGEEERRIFLKYIATETEQLAGIVDALLSVARLESGDLQLQLAMTDLRDVVTEVVSSAQREVVNGRRFVIDVPEEPLDAAADRDKVRQILANLVDNAVKFSPHGGTVTVAARRTSGAVQVRVLDEGAGVPAAEQEHIFRKFYRADVAGARGSGTGLGLFIARGLATAMGGRLWMDSETDSWRQLRLRAADRRTVCGGPGRGQDEHASARGARMTKVLVVDDEAPIRLLCRVNLEADGMEVIEAADGQTGLALARSEQPDVILLDVMMPTMDGWQVAEQLVDDAQAGQIPLVFLTARAELRDRARGLELGGVDYITKPFDPVELASVVQGLLERVRRGERDELRQEKIAELRDLLIE